MELGHFKFDMKSRSDTINVVLIADVHCGSKMCGESLLERVVEYVRKSSNTYWVDMGDKIDAINISDKRFEPGNLPDWLKMEDLDRLKYRQAERYIEMVDPIKDKCLAMVTGNHEEKAKKIYHFDSHYYICNQLGTPNMGWTSMLSLDFNRKTGTTRSGRRINLLLEHGCSGGRTKGSKLNILERRMNDFPNADVLIEGHAHDEVYAFKQSLKVNLSGKPEILPFTRVLINCPSFYRSYIQGSVSYAERSQYPVSSIGALVLTIKPFSQQRLDENRTQEVPYYKVNSIEID